MPILPLPLSVQIDIKENDASFEVVADVPGVPKTGVTCELGADNTLYITAKKSSEAKDSGVRDGWTFHREERSSEQRWRSVRLPPNVDSTHISAKIEDGVLHVTMPKRPGASATTGNRTAIPIV